MHLQLFLTDVTCSISTGSDTNVETNLVPPLMSLSVVLLQHHLLMKLILTFLIICATTSTPFVQIFAMNFGISSHTFWERHRNSCLFTRVLPFYYISNYALIDSVVVGTNNQVFVVSLHALFSFLSDLHNYYFY